MVHHDARLHWCLLKFLILGVARGHSPDLGASFQLHLNVWGFLSASPAWGEGARVVVHATPLQDDLGKCHPCGSS